MSTKAYQAREREKEHRKRLSIGAFVGGAALSILTFLLPHSLAFLLPSLLILFLCLTYLSWICYGLRETWPLRLLCFTTSVAALSYLSVHIWPRLSVTPTEVKLRHDESFDFTLRNKTDNDYSIVNVEMEVAGDSDLNNFHLYMWPSLEDRRPPLADIEFTNDYDLCHGNDGKSYIIAIAKNVGIDEKQKFTLRYKGNKEVVLKTAAPNGTKEPLAYDAHQDDAITSSGAQPSWLAKSYRNCVMTQFLKDRPGM